jgi:hypothetical protein
VPDLSAISVEDERTHARFGQGGCEDGQKQDEKASAQPDRSVAANEGYSKVAAAPKQADAFLAALPAGKAKSTADPWR